jgi:hypothetical protein
MIDTIDIVKNIENIYDSDTQFQVLKDFERVLDELDLYVYDNWKDGELVAGPELGRHWVTCSFMWPKEKMPDPMGGKRLLDYDCKVSYKKDSIIVPRKIKKPDDVRPGTKKGKLDRNPIWIVEIQMPKKLIMDIYSGYKEQVTDTTAEPNVEAEAQTAETQASEATPDLDLGLE